MKGLALIAHMQQHPGTLYHRPRSYFARWRVYLTLDTDGVIALDGINGTQHAANLDALCDDDWEPLP